MSYYDRDADDYERRVRFVDDRDGERQRRYERTPSPRPVRYVPTQRARTRSRSSSHERTSYGGGPPQPPPPPRRPTAGWPSSDDDDDDDGDSDNSIGTPPGDNDFVRRHLGRSSTDSTSTSNASNESRYPRKGKTRIPARLISKRALIDLGYPFTVEGDKIVVLKALGQNNIDELLELSNEYQKSDHVFALDRPSYEDERVVRVGAGHPFERPPTLPPPLDDLRRHRQFEETQRFLQEQIELNERQRSEAENELREIREKDLRAEAHLATALRVELARHRTLIAERNRCESQLKQEQEKAESWTVLNSRLQNLELDEAHVLSQQRKASEEEEYDVEGPEEEVAKSHEEYRQYLTSRLLTVQLETDQVSQKRRAADTARIASQELSRELERLTRAAKGAEERRMQIRIEKANVSLSIRAGCPEGDRASSKLRTLEEKGRSLKEELEVLRRDRLQFERSVSYRPTPPPPPPPPPVVRHHTYIDNRERDRSHTSRTSPQPVVVNRSFYDDYSSDPSESIHDREFEWVREKRRYRYPDSETLSDGSSDEHEEDASFDILRRTYKAVEKAGLSVSFPLDKGVRAIHIHGSDDEEVALTSEARAWKEDKTVLSDGVSSTELRVIHAAEYLEDETGVGKTTLMCLDGPRDRESLKSAQMRWLHIQQPSLKFKTLEDIVISSDIDGDLRRIAVEAMEKVKDKFSGVSECGAYLEPGSILRYIGEKDGIKGERATSRETEPVVFLSSPFLTLQPSSGRRASKYEYRPRSLLQSLYGYDVGGERESGQVVQKLNITKSKKDMLHINQLWCLVIGSKVLVTMSEQSAAQVRGDSVAMDSRNSSNKEPLVVRLIDCDNREYRMVVERDCNYVDFLIYAVARVAGPNANALQWDLFDENDEILTPNRWIDIMSSTDGKLRSFSVTDRTVFDTDSETSEYSAALVPRPPLRSRSESRGYHASRSHAYPSRESERIQISRRSMSQYDLRSSSRSQSNHYHRGHPSSRSMVTIRDRPSRARSYAGPYKDSRSSDPPAYASPSLVSRDRSQHCGHSRGPLASENAGVLVPYIRKTSSDHESSKAKPEVVRTDMEEDAESSGEEKRDSNDSNGSPWLSSNASGNGDEDYAEATDGKGDFKWSHLSDIVEERSSSAATPRIGVSSKHGGLPSDSDGDEDDEESEVTSSPHETGSDPRNMQLILRPKAIDPGTGTLDPAAGRPSSEHSGATVDIGEPWRAMVERSASDIDETHSYELPVRSPSPGPSRSLIPFDSANVIPRAPLSPIEESLHNEGIALDDLHRQLASALNHGNHGLAADLRYAKLPEKELTVQGILQTAITLPQLGEIDRDSQAVGDSLDFYHRRQQKQDHDEIDGLQRPVALIQLERTKRRLVLVRRATEFMPSSEIESKLAGAWRKLGTLRTRLHEAELAGDYSRAADLKYYSIPNAQLAIEHISAEEQNAQQSRGRPLDRISVLQWAYSRGHFDSPARYTPTPAGFVGIDHKSLLEPGVEQALVRRARPSSSSRRPHRTESLPGQDGIYVSGYAHTSRSRFEEEDTTFNRSRLSRDREYPSADSRYYITPPNFYRNHSSRAPMSRHFETPRRSYTRGSASPSTPPRSSPPTSVDYSSDETLAPGVILNERPRHRRRVPEVYDTGETPQRPAAERPIPSDTETRERPVDDTGSITTSSYGEDDDDHLRTRSTNTERHSDLPMKTEVARKPSRDDARRFRRIVLRRYVPEAGLDPIRVKLARGQMETVEDENIDGPFAQGCRTFYRKDPKPRPGEKADWVDEFVIDHRNLPWKEGAVFIVAVEWPPLSEATGVTGMSQAMRISLDPFLRWRVKSSDSKRSPEEIDRSVLKVLGTIDESLQVGNFREMYSRTYMCTLRDLFERHNFLTQVPTQYQSVLEEVDTVSVDETARMARQSSNGAEDVSHVKRTPSTEEKTSSEGGSAACKKPSQDEEAPKWQQGGKRPESRRPGHSMPGEGASGNPSAQPPSQRDQSLGTLSHDQTVMKQLLDVSNNLLGAYMPSEGSPLLNSVCQRFWGNVDEIFRQIIWQTIDLRNSLEEATFVIRDFDVPSTIIGRAHQAANLKKSWSSCLRCKGGEIYNQISEALTHLHKDHFDCSGKIQQSYDDPCFVWLCPLYAAVQPPLPGKRNYYPVEDFISQLLLVSNYSKELHSLVASIHGTSMESRPQLPTNVVLAFEQIMAMYMIFAHRLSLYNTRKAFKSRSRRLDNKISELAERGELAQQQVMDHLTEAKKDITLLRGTSRQIDSLSVEAIGVEFLVLSLITNLQNRSLVSKPAPYTSEKVDFVEVYQRYTSSLRFQANRRPKKRVFLDIHGLEEELDALYGMLEAQRSLLCNYLALLSPGSTRATSATRVGQHKIELAYARKQQKNLDAKKKGIETLRDKSGVLKEQVKKIIEILEEDHGKAIRVFTFVTLLFLPLSFVTSFMGMNTTDIRDTEWSQQIFWATGLPVTIVVVILALIYAYRGERIQDWISTHLKPKRRHAGRSMGGSFAWSGEPAPEGDTFLLRGGTKRKGVIHVDSNALRRPSGLRGTGSEPQWMRDARQRLRARQKGRGASGLKTRESLAR